MKRLGKGKQESEGAVKRKWEVRHANCHSLAPPGKWGYAHISLVCLHCVVLVPQI